MQTNYEILELFPTPVFTTTLPQEFASVVPWFYKQEMLSEEVDSSNYGERSKNSYILNEPECSKLGNHILNIVPQFGKTLGLDYDSYKFGQSWLSFKHPGQHHTMHTHPNSLISGVFYFGKPVEKTPAVKFHKPILGVNVSYISPKTLADKRESKYAWSEFSVEFLPGLLLLFPSHLNHSVPLNKTDTTRCSLAFNIVPSIGFGDETSLTELKF
jgi:uncharacterized protein (TIGR02466 family)